MRGGEWIPGVGALSRLVDDTGEVGFEPGRLWAIELLRAVEHHEMAPARKQRLWLGLRVSRGRRGPLLLRPIVIVGVLVGGAALASAALGHIPEWVVDAYQKLMPGAAPHRLAPQRPQDQTHVSAHPRRTAQGAPPSNTMLPTSRTPPQWADSPIAPPAPAIETPPAPVPPPPPSSTGAMATAGAPATSTTAALPRSRAIHPAEFVAPVAAEPSRFHERAPAAQARRPSTASATRDAASPGASTHGEGTHDDSTPVVTAMRVLRRDKNPARARRLLVGYLTAHPNGALAEEALAILIEAAATNHDSDASALSDRYLRKYPSGPFRALASRTLAASTTR